MSHYLRQSTASQEVILGPFLDDTDGKTAESALTIANTDIKLWVTGATSEASKNSGGATHMTAGRYSAVLDATDTATIGPGEINVAVAGALPVKLRFIVLHANVYDVLFGTVAPSTHTAAAVQALVAAGVVASVTGNVGGNVTGSVGSVTGNVGGNVVGSVASVAAAVTVTGTPAVNVTQISGDATAADNAESFFDGTGYAGTNNVIPLVTTTTTLTNKTGFSLTQAFPTNFSSLGINASGHVSRVVLVDTTTSNTDMRGTDNAALAATALSTAVWTGTKAGYLDAAISSVSTGGVSAGDIATAVWTAIPSGTPLQDIVDAIEDVTPPGERTILLISVP